MLQGTHALVRMHRSALMLPLTLFCATKMLRRNVMYSVEAKPSGAVSPGSPITVSAKVRPNQGAIAAVTLLVRTNYAPEQRISMTAEEEAGAWGCRVGLLVQRSAGAPIDGSRNVCACSGSFCLVTNMTTLALASLVDPDHQVSVAQGAIGCCITVEHEHAVICMADVYDLQRSVFAPHCICAADKNGDVEYTATIPGALVTAGSMIRWRVEVCSPVVNILNLGAGGCICRDMMRSCLKPVPHNRAVTCPGRRSL